MLKNILKHLFLLLLTSSCTGVGSQVFKVNRQTKILYTFDNPQQNWQLDFALQEISGLDFDASTDKLVAVNDEKGNVYAIDPYTGRSEKLYEFHKNGDYEGIAVVDKHHYVLKSNGKLYRYNLKKEKTKEIETKLSAKNDCEGLCYNASSQRLLIACKGMPLDERKNIKAVYKYSIEEQKVSKKPVVEINLQVLKEKGEEAELTPNQQWRIRRFSPSGIAIHPQTHDYYILSARGSMLLVINEEQKIEHLVFLNITQLPQPEGICFDKDHNLFISSEGKADRGKLLKYKMR